MTRTIQKQPEGPGARRGRASRDVSVMVLGVGSFAQSTAQILKEDGARVSTYLTRSYGHYAPSLAGPVYHQEQFPSPAPLLERNGTEMVIPMSIDWAQASWKDDLLKSRVPIFGPSHEAMRLERERDFARRLCREFRIPFPEAHVARNRLDADEILARHPRPFVIKNPLCSPTSPVHTIICETIEDTRSWLRQIDYAEGVFLQEYLGKREVGHIALVSAGEIYSLVTNQEYKRAFDGDLGIAAGAPLGGLVQKDPADQYGLAQQLLHPLRPWFREVDYHGPVQVTAMLHKDQWHVLEYNIRLGITSGAMILRLLSNPLETLLRTAQNKALKPSFMPRRNFGCSVTLAGYGYPYVQIQGPPVPVELLAPCDCDLWWNEAALNPERRLVATGHRIADVIALGEVVQEAIDGAYSNIRKLRSLGSYYRQDIGQSLWPPGNC